MVQIELAANAIVPDGHATSTDVLITAHLRCSPAAAADIRDSIKKALEMLTVGQSVKPN
jgi:hypothetical protein